MTVPDLFENIPTSAGFRSGDEIVATRLHGSLLTEKLGNHRRRECHHAAKKIKGQCHRIVARPAFFCNLMMDN